MKLLMLVEDKVGEDGVYKFSNNMYKYSGLVDIFHGSLDPTSREETPSTFVDVALPIRCLISTVPLECISI